MLNLASTFVRFRIAGQEVQKLLKTAFLSTVAASLCISVIEPGWFRIRKFYKIESAIKSIHIQVRLSYP